MAIDKAIDFNLYLITDQEVAGDRDLVSLIEQALKGGVKAVQLREKGQRTHASSGREVFELAKKLRELTDKYGAQLLINDRVDICLAVGADGVHLPSDGMSIKDARVLLGKDKLIGVSCHSEEEVRGAKIDGADFVTIGPIYDTPSKRQYGEPLGEDILNKLRDCAIKKFALGGVKLENIKECISSGADGIALISGILAPIDRGKVLSVEETTREYLKKLNS